ncbi:MAG TPA: hemerythrin domain-containing protein [Polyangia bacterium]|nr:hemerythrin domain-containing protein [Polyangia bacterium]
MTSVTPRLDIFMPIHHGLRRSLFETATLLARTDFAAAAESDAAEQLATSCLELLHDHADHEDQFVLPEVERFSPELAAALAQEHQDLEGAGDAIESLWPRLPTFDAPARLALGGEIGRRFRMVVADQLLHMDREEREVNALFWARLSDPQIAALNDRIVTSIGPARMQVWNALVLPSLSRPLREAIEQRR